MYYLQDPAGQEANLALPTEAYDMPLIISEHSFYSNGSMVPPWLFESNGTLFAVNGRVSSSLLFS